MGPLTGPDAEGAKERASIVHVNGWPGLLNMAVVTVSQDACQCRTNKMPTDEMTWPAKDWLQMRRLVESKEQQTCEAASELCGGCLY